MIEDTEYSFSTEYSYKRKIIGGSGDYLPLGLIIYEPCHRKPVFGVCDQVRLKPACSATETS